VMLGHPAHVGASVAGEWGWRGCHCQRWACNALLWRAMTVVSGCMVLRPWQVNLGNLDCWLRACGECRGEFIGLSGSAGEVR
jgi:hypothetical protein